MLFRLKAELARTAATLSRATGRGGGTTLPGKLLLGLEPRAIERLGPGLKGGSVVVSATNGKTTTAKMAAAILEPEILLCRNAAGANLASGVASALLACQGTTMGLFEVDEAALPAVTGALHPRTVVLGNLFRDQLDRYGELELVGERWREMAAELVDGTLVCNADDPLVASIGRDNDALWFGIDDPAVALPALPHAADSKWCIRCGERYEYDAVYLGHLGSWRCPRCGDTRPGLDVAAREIRAEGLTAVTFRLSTPLGEEQVRLPMPGLYNVYNALAAAALAVHAAQVAPARIRAGLERFSAAFGRFERVELAGRPAILLLIKNPAGTNEVIRTLAQEPAKKTLLVALNDRIADGRDVSWIWDVDFEVLTQQVDRVVVTGTRAAEMGMRLKYAGVEPGLVEVAPLDAALELVGRRGDGPVYLLATYTAMLELRRRLADMGVVRPFWEEAA